MPPANNSLFEAIANDGYRIGNCFVLPYDRHRPDIFGSNYLSYLYNQCLLSAPNRPYGIIPESFCSMQDLSLDAICAYLHTRNPLLLMCMDNPSDPTKFDVIGFSFPSIWCGGFQSDAVPDPDRSMLMGYVMFRPYYGTPEANVCMTLTGLYFFHKFKLVSISGQSYTFNHLTRKFLAQFGAKDVGVLPRFLNLNGKLVDCHLTCLLREDFERHLAASLTIPVPSQ